MRSIFPLGRSNHGQQGHSKSSGETVLWHRIIFGVAVILLLVAAWVAAVVTYRIITPVQVSPSNPISSGQNNGRQVSQPISTQRITSLNLFGERGAEGAAPRQTREDAPQTTLNITLVGVTAATDPNRSAAIIQQGGNQNVYIIDETIAGSRAIVREIYADRIILENAGRRETLMLEGADGNTGSLSLVTSAPRRPAPNAQVAPPANTAAVPASYANIAELLRITPETREGQLVGYRLAPNRDPQIFTNAGFVNGDIAISMNGYDLTNAAEALALLNELEMLSSATVVVLRNGELVELDISIPNE